MYMYKVWEKAKGTEGSRGIENIELDRIAKYSSRGV